MGSMLKGKNFLLSDPLLKEKLCSLRSKVFPSKVNPILDGLFLSRKSQNLSPLVKMVGKHEEVPTHLKTVHFFMLPGECCIKY